MTVDSLELFGTDGIRKVVGTEITPTFIANVISAYAEWIDGAGPVLIAHDFRTSSDGLARICAGTLQMNGVDVLEMGVMPTPCLQFNVRALGARAGLMITASHNPTEFNGIKFSGPKGLEIPPEAELRIADAYRNRRNRLKGWDGMGCIDRDTGGIERYLASIVDHVDRESIRAASPRTVLDCGNGTGSTTVPRLLRKLLGGRFVTLNANPDGSFPGHPSEPTHENLRDLEQGVVQFGAELGIALDGDSDRVAFVDEKGQLVPGEVTLALFARDVLRRHPSSPIVTSVTSSQVIEDVVRQEGGKLVITKSGSLPVAEGIAQENACFGGEENGHFYWPEHQDAPDGPMSAAMMLELLTRARRPLSQLVAEMPRYAVVKENVPLPRALRDRTMTRVREVLSSEAESILTMDGVKAFWPEGWLLIRPSGTEPICRIFSESKDPEVALRLNRKGIELVQALVREPDAGGQAR